MKIIIKNNIIHATHEDYVDIDGAYPVECSIVTITRQTWLDIKSNLPEGEFIYGQPKSVLPE
jgi:hypothetical protein